jgi:hypothetical protein
MRGNDFKSTIYTTFKELIIIQFNGLISLEEDWPSLQRRPLVPYQQMPAVCMPGLPPLRTQNGPRVHVLEWMSLKMPTIAAISGAPRPKCMAG